MAGRVDTEPGRPAAGGPGADPLLSARGVRKRYGAVTALAGADLDVSAGEVVALLGANGSGKSTLGRVLTGVTRPDAGELRFAGRPVDLPSPMAARRLGVGAVYQELSLVPDMTVAENVWLGHEPTRRGGVDRRAMRERTAELLELFAGTFAVRVTPDTVVADLPQAGRQVIEVLKAYSWSPRVLILDEATASLDSRQVDRLFELVGRWREEGMALVFVSHRMGEIFRVADRAVVLRNGATVGMRPIAETDEAELVALLTGGTGAAPRRARAVAAEASVGPGTPEAAVGEPPLLELRGYSSPGLAPLDLRVARGELLGLGGLQGQGQSRLLLSLFGAAPHHGEVLLDGRRVTFRSPRQAMAAGVAYVPGDRNEAGLLPFRPLLENLQLPNWGRYGVPLRMRAARRDAADAADELSVRHGGLDESVGTLSGGNAQKVVIAKWLLRRPRLLLLDDPTKGVDVGAKAEFYAFLEELRRRGVTVLFNSSDDLELLGLCERVLVLHDGRVAAELAGDTLDRDHLVAAAMGGGAPAGAPADDAGVPSGGPSGGGGGGPSGGMGGRA